MQAGRPSWKFKVRLKPLFQFNVMVVSMGKAQAWEMS